MTDTRTQTEIDRENSAFWNEMCGSLLARKLGITDDSQASLRKFDDWYMGYYPYLYDFIPFERLAGKRVLEVGLGYGTVSQKLVEAGAAYQGLDIAAGPVALVNKRISDIGAAGVATQASILEPPFAAGSFDWVVAIGCLHHTGDLARALDSVRRLLKEGGEAMIMVYNAASYRQWRDAPLKTALRRFSDPTTYSARRAGDERARAQYDTNSAGAAAPQTEYVTKSELAHLCRAFAACEITATNIGDEKPFRGVPRETAIRRYGSRLGLDLYCHLRT